MHLTTISSSYQQQDQTHSDNPTQTIMCCLPAQKGILPCRMISSMIQYQQLNACDRGFHSVLFGCDDGSISLETLTIPVVVCGCGGRGHTLVTNVMDQANPKPYTTLCVQVRARFVERFSMGTGGEAGNQSFRGLDDKVSWVEKFVRVGASGMEAAHDEYNRQGPRAAPPHRIAGLLAQNYSSTCPGIKGRL